MVELTLVPRPVLVKGFTEGWKYDSPGGGSCAGKYKGFITF